MVNSSIVEVLWDVVINADYYQVERDSSTLFLNPIVTYYGPDISYFDIVPEKQSAYCRVKAISFLYGIESDWSPPMKIPAIPEPDFNGFRRGSGPSIVFD